MYIPKEGNQEDVGRQKGGQQWVESLFWDPTLHFLEKLH
jgi:hypothetical protein